MPAAEPFYFIASTLNLDSTKLSHTSPARVPLEKRSDNLDHFCAIYTQKKNKWRSLHIIFLFVYLPYRRERINHFSTQDSNESSGSEAIMFVNKIFQIPGLYNYHKFTKYDELSVNLRNGNNVGLPNKLKFLKEKLIFIWELRTRLRVRWWKMAPGKDYFERDTVKLIKHITGFEESDENFGICLDYALSVFCYHQFLDINRHQVQRCINGLHQKFLIHSQMEKAAAFLNLTTKFLESPLFKDHMQAEIQYVILSFLLNLANNPTETSYAVRELQKNDEQADDFNWGKFLLDGEVIESPLSEDLSDWSDVEDEAYDSKSLIKDSVKIDQNELISADMLRKNSMHRVAGPKIGRAWFRDHLTNFYWCESQGPMENVAKHKSATFLRTWEDYLEESGVLFVRSSNTVLTERQILRECIWLLQGIGDTFVFPNNGKEHKLRDDICVSHLTRESVTAMLTEILKYGNIVRKLHHFSEEVAIRINKTEVTDSLDYLPICHTYQAYAASISYYLKLFTKELIEIEKKIIAQEETYTLANLMTDLAPWLQKLLLLDQVHQLGIESVTSNSPTWVSASTLLSKLHECLCDVDIMGGGGLNLVQLLLGLFLSTLKPYIDIMDNWVVTGVLEDRYEEFIIQRSTKSHLQDENFWDTAITLRNAETDQQKEQKKISSPVPQFLKPFLDKLILAGKSMEMLRLLGKLHYVPTCEINNKMDFYSAFIEKLTNLLSTTLPNECELYQETVERNSHQDARSKDYFAITLEEKSTDKTLQLNLKQLLGSDDIHNSLLNVSFDYVRNSKEHSTTLQHGSTESLLQKFHPPYHCPLQQAVHHALKPLINKKYEDSCKTLIHTLQSDYQLWECLSVMRQFFLMEAGDTMFSFYSELFDRIRNGDSWQDEKLLTVLLQDALSSHFPKLIKRVTVTLESNSQRSNKRIAALDNLKLQCKIRWPINVVLTSEIQKMYNQIFGFLLQVKWAKYSLDELSFRDLDSNHMVCSPLLFGKSCETESAQELPDRQKLHQIHLLRFELMHFVNSLHNYVMTRVLHSTGLELQEALQEASDLQQIISVHLNYINVLHHRCLFQSKVFMFRQAVLRVLDLALNFRSEWNVGLKRFSSKKLKEMEEEFKQCHLFLGSFLSNIVKHGTYPHLELLAFSLVSSNDKRLRHFR